MDYTYLIIGGGMTADAAVQGIRSVDASGKIGIISDDRYPPYNRPLLSKGLWVGESFDSIWLKTEEAKVSLHLETRAVSIDLVNKTVTDNKGNSYSYKKLLLATGGSPNRLSCSDPDVNYFRTLDDYNRLHELYLRGESFVIIGSGFVATELAASLAMNGKNVAMLFRAPAIGSKVYPKGFANFLNAYFTEHGVKLIPHSTPTSIVKKGNQYLVTTNNGTELIADGVVAGIGIHPNIELAEKCGLNIDDGIVVDSFLQTSQPNIYAAGDVANFYSPTLDKRVRIEHEDSANSMGFCVGKNMAGKQEEYNYLPYFYSDHFELGYEAVGEIDGSMEMVEDWHDQYRKGVIYYLQDGYVRGAVLWGIWDKVDQMKELIASKQKFTPDLLIGKIVI
ncbi:MAG: Putidaredoxin reductase [Chlamydiae bacterium]|nr:Putidaredoxin reductase [Chlamydiota bacterium]